MSLLYIVNINIDDQTARAVQVIANAVSFRKILGEKFKLISCGNGNKDYLCSRNVFGIRKESSALRKIIFHAQVFFDLLLAKKEFVIYSRNLSVLALASLLGRKTVWEMHDRPLGLNEWLLRYLAKNNLKVVAISNALLDFLLKDYVIDRNNIIVAHDGVFTSLYKATKSQFEPVETRKSYELPVDKFVLMHCGSLYSGRGMEMFAHIAENFPQIQLVQVGGRGEDFDRWNDAYSGYANVTFIAHQSNDVLIKLQLCADAFILPMTKESKIWWCTSPMKLFEYMAAGAPILHTNIGSITEVLNSTNSVSFDHSSTESLVEALSKIMKNPTLCKQLAENAYNECVLNYDWAVRAEKIVSFCKEESFS